MVSTRRSRQAPVSDVELTVPPQAGSSSTAKGPRKKPQGTSTSGQNISGNFFEERESQAAEMPATNDSRNPDEELEFVGDQEINLTTSHTEQHQRYVMADAHTTGLNLTASTQHSKHVSEAVETSHSSDEEGDILADLASVFRAQLQARSSARPSSDSASRDAALRCPATTSAPEPELIGLNSKLEDDLEDLRWEPVVDTSSGPSRRAAVPTATAAAKEKGLAKQVLAPPRDPRRLAQAARKRKPDTAGHKWYNLPATAMTDDVKRDLRLLRLRGAYDPKRFYKNFDKGAFPKYFAMGTVVEPASEFYSGRLSKKERKGTMTEELMADPQLGGSRKKRYNQLQEDAQRWAKHKKRRTGLPRENKKKPKPKH